MPRHNNLSDLDLLQQMADGHEPALGTFYDRYRGLVFSLVRQMLRDGPEAEEVTLDIFVKIWQQAAQFDPQRAAPKTWLARIARNSTIDRLRRRSVRRDQDCNNWVEDALDWLPAQGDVETQIGDRELHRQMRQAIADLPEQQREALALAYFSGCTQSEIAARLGQPLGTVKTRIRAAMQALREKFEDAT